MGTWFYMAPEIYRQETYDEKADVFSELPWQGSAPGQGGGGTSPFLSNAFEPSPFLDLAAGAAALALAADICV